MLKVIRPVESKIFNINEPFGIKMLATQRLGFRHLHEHKFRHSFKDTLNPLFSFSIKAKTTTHYFWRCHFLNSNETTFVIDWKYIFISFFTFSDNNLINLLFYGDDKFKGTKNRKILKSTKSMIKVSGLVSNFFKQRQHLKLLFFATTLVMFTLSLLFFVLVKKLLFYPFKELVLVVIFFRALFCVFYIIVSAYE